MRIAARPFYVGERMVISAKLSDEKLLEEIRKSAKVYSSLIGYTYLIVGQNKRTPFFHFECEFEEKNLMHLLGIDSKTYSAQEFYEVCLGKGKEKLKISDCTPSRNHSRTHVNEKCSCSAEMFDLRNAKYMQVGLKDKISQFVDFTYAYGNEATLGFRKTPAGNFPITLIPRKLDEFAVDKYKILLILRKPNQDSGPYREVVHEIKPGFLSTVYESFSEDLKQLVSPQLVSPPPTTKFISK